MILKYINYDLYLYRLFTFDCTLESLVREQYELAKKGISLYESSSIPLFEKDAFVNLVLSDRQNELDAYENALKS